MTSYLLMGVALAMGPAQADPAPSVRVLTTAVPNAYGDPDRASVAAMLPASAPALPAVPPQNSAATLPVAPPVIYPVTSVSTPQGQNGAEQKNAAEKKNGDASTDKKDGDNSAEKQTADASADQHNPDNWTTNILTPRRDSGGCVWRFYKAYYDEFFPKKDKDKENAEAETPPAPRRGLPEAWPSPPFPGHEYQGYPLIGVPPDSDVYPFMKALYGANTPFTDAIKDSRIKFSGWVTTAGTWSTATNSNVPAAYWIVPNRYELDQLVFKLERVPDTVQTDHIDWGFRFIGLYGMDYRYTTAGGWASDQLLEHNLLYGWDPTEVYINFYIPGFLDGTDIRIGRWIACPDIETQYSVDNYVGSHSILFTYDTYTQTGIMVSQKIDAQWMVQGVIHSGTDMAPWYKGSLLTGAAGVRWVSKDNNDAMYTWLNAINSAKFRHFEEYGQPLGHDNFNYVVTTWEHKFNEQVHTNTEAYYMWQRDAELGGTPSAGPPKPFGGGGGDGMLLPGLSEAFGVLNYTMFGLTKNDYITVRNEWWKDTRGMRSGFPGNYTSHTIGLSHNFNALFQVRPEIGYYRNWDNQAFDLGKKNGIWIYGFDMTLRF
jgi:hypothetical protein